MTILTNQIKKTSELEGPFREYLSFFFYDIVERIKTDYGIYKILYSHLQNTSYMKETTEVCKLYVL